MSSPGMMECDKNETQGMLYQSRGFAQRPAALVFMRDSTCARCVRSLARQPCEQKPISFQAKEAICKSKCLKLVQNLRKAARYKDSRRRDRKFDSSHISLRLFVGCSCLYTYLRPLSRILFFFHLDFQAFLSFLLEGRVEENKIFSFLITHAPSSIVLHSPYLHLPFDTTT